MSGPTQFTSVLFKEQNCIGLSASLNGSSRRSCGSESDQPLNKTDGNWASQVALVIKKLPANETDMRETGSIPGSGRFPGGGNGNSLQYSCLENPMDRGAWWAIIHRIAKIQAWLKWQHALRWKLTTVWECQFSKNQAISISNRCTTSPGDLGGFFCRSRSLRPFQASLSHHDISSIPIAAHLSRKLEEISLLIEVNHGQC